MSARQSLAESVITTKIYQNLWRLAFLVCGLAALALLAQISWRLPFLSKPLTGQTFAVMLIALLYGARLATGTVTVYLILGAIGWPVFSGGKSGLALVPSSGFLFGMLVGAAIMGWLADRGWGRSAGKALAACFIGQLAIFAVGLFGLSYMIYNPQTLLKVGLWPHLSGTAIKMILAAGLATFAYRRLTPAR